jgi:lysophospholipase L1-like esterase
LQRIYPQAKIEMFNAGVSGNTSAAGLARMDKDVLARKPDLVVVMFGMNDCPSGKMEVYRGNLKEIVARARKAGAEVVLCTPNSIYPEDQRRPAERLAAYAETVRAVAAEMSVPLADCYRAYEDLRAKDPVEWKLLMSETIHPCMNGHKLFAEVIAETISGKRVSLDDVPPPTPSLSFTFDRLSKNQPVAMIAMPPYDRLMVEALRRLYPEAQISVTPWPIAGGSVRAMEQWGKGIRGRKPNLVVFAVPAEAIAANEEEFMRSHNWILNWGLAFGKQEWDAIAILPSVTKPQLSADELRRADLARRVVVGRDIGFVERQARNDAPLEGILTRWLEEQHRSWTAARNK